MEGELRKGEIVTLAKPGRKSAAKAKVLAVTGGRGDLGGGEPKVRFDAVVGENEKRLKVVTKVASIYPKDVCFGSETQQMPFAQRYFERWRFLRQIGIPTVSSMRVIDAKTIAMGDMTRDGSEFFGKAFALRMRNRAALGLKRGLTSMEKVFLSVPEDEVKAEMKKVAELAEANGVRLPPDERCEFLVHPDGTWEVIVLDLSQLEKIKEKMDIDQEVELMYGPIKRSRLALEQINNE